MSIKSKARRRGIAGAIASLSNAAIDVHGRRKSVICGLSRYKYFSSYFLGVRSEKREGRKRVNYFSACMTDAKNL
ncbi:MAG: hypothetical protein BA865_03340 [Desulfobacterales bacterium S5133MH4]|nr:MAG: hypothetical protein BA865_03340 [Desulfobacterales bacterium S5133MH4]